MGHDRYMGVSGKFMDNAYYEKTMCGVHMFYTQTNLSFHSIFHELLENPLVLQAGEDRALMWVIRMVGEAERNMRVRTEGALVR